MSICQEKHNPEEIIYSKSILVKSFDEIKGYFKGYGLVYGNIDRVDDIIQAGATVKSIQEYKGGTKTIKALWQHSDDYLLSDNLLDINSDSIGDLIELQISDTFKLEFSEHYKEIIELAQLKHLSFSVGYRIIKSHYEKIYGKAIRVIEEMEIIEFSLVTNPANPEAVVTEFKSIDVKPSEVFEDKTINYKSFNKEFILSQARNIKSVVQAKEIVRKHKHDLSGKQIERIFDKVVEITTSNIKGEELKKLDKEVNVDNNTNIGEQKSRSSEKVVSNHKLDLAKIAQQLSK